MDALFASLLPREMQNIPDLVTVMRDYLEEPCAFRSLKCVTPEDNAADFAALVPFTGGAYWCRAHFHDRFEYHLYTLKEFKQVVRETAM
jgi:hypothetical protein